MSNGITSRETSYSVRGVYRFDSILSLSFLSLSLSRQSSSDQRTGLKVTNALTHACHRYSHWFFPPLSLSFSLSQCPPSSSFHPTSLSPLFFYAPRERERENSSFLGGREEKTPLFSSSFSSSPSSSREEKKEKIRRGIERRNTSSSWHVESKERFRGLNPGCNKVHQARYLATVIGLRCHESYVIILCGTWEAAVRGFPDWRGEREREIGLLKLFSLSVFAERASFAWLTEPGCTIGRIR